MSKKVILGMMLAIIFSFAGLLAHQNRVLAWAQTGYPCSVGGNGLASGCQGYYTGADAPIYTCANSPAPLTRPCIDATVLLSNGMNVNSIPALWAAVGADLYSANLQNSRGAAFIVNAMMGNKGPNANGVLVAAAPAEFLAWEKKVQYFDGTHAGYTINWSYMETCANSAGLPNSSFINDPNNPRDNHDDIFHNFICQYQDAGIDDGPAILFQWPGGAFAIGRSCGNVQGYIDVLPSPKPISPTGKITVTCNPNTSQFTAAVTFGDSNGYSTSGAISTTGPGGSYNTAVTSGKSYPIPTKYTSPTKSQVVTLTVTDQGTNTNYTAPTPVPPPCQLSTKPTGKITVTCSDPSTGQFTAAVTFGDSNGNSTTGSISTGSYNTAVTSGKSYPITTKYTSPTKSQVVTLTVTDQGTNTNYTAPTPVPPPCQPATSPFGKITVTCSDPSTSQFTAAVTFGDNNGYTTTGSISTTGPGGKYSTAVTSGKSYPIPQSATDPYSSQTVTLTVADQGTNTNYNASTPVPPPCVILTCGNLSTTPSNIDPNTRYSATVSVTNSAGIPPPKATMKINITPSGGVNSGSQNVPGSGSISSATFSGLGPTGGAPALITVTWTLTASGGLSKTCTGTFQVADLPYLQVFGGDVMVGASPTFNSSTKTSSCFSDNNGGIYSWNNGAPDFSGAGAEYAVQALSQIEGFASAQDPTISPPTDLSFAGTGPDTNVNNGMFGGAFGGTTTDCDFTKNATITNSPRGLPIDLPAPITNGTQLSYYIEGNVYIGKNITYNLSGWNTSPNVNIPNFRLVVVGGNIYIDPSVTELDGLYVAEPETTGSITKGGTIYTCGTSLYTPIPADSNLSGACNNKLTIYGSFVAQQVEFLRDNGSVGQATKIDSITSNHAAEVFDYTPEMWLPRSNGITNGGYTAITGLPPVL
jgi:hypothetical protein